MKTLDQFIRNVSGASGEIALLVVECIETGAWQARVSLVGKPLAPVTLETRWQITASFEARTMQGAIDGLSFLIFNDR